MNDYLAKFYFSLAEELIPEIAERPISSDKEFAVILENGDTLSAVDIERISESTSLVPIFFVISRDESLDISRLYSRWLGAPTVIPKSLRDAVSAISECNFSVSEKSDGALLSFLAGTPAYLNSGSRGCREIIADFSKSAFFSSMFIPYTKGRINLIKRVSVDRALYREEIKKLRTDICAKLSDILGKS